MRGGILGFILPALAVAGLLLGGIAVFASLRKPMTPTIPFPPPKTPYESFIAAEGMVEAASEDIFIGTPLSEIVTEVFVEAGDLVEKDAPLFKLNTEVFEAELKEALAAVAVAQAEYDKQLDLPRPEDIPPLKARVKQANAELRDKVAQFELMDRLENPKAVSRDEYNQRKFGALLAEYKLLESEEELNLLMAGAWVRDLEIYRARLKEAQSRTAVIQKRIDLSTICAPFRGYAMRVNIRVAEFAQAGELETPLIIFGSVGCLNIRVNVDEEDAWRVIPGAKGWAYVRGNSNIRVPINYLRLEPYLIPKPSLTGEDTERVDTRVLQVIYDFKRDNLPIYPGMLLDVYIEGKPYSEAEAQKE